MLVYESKALVTTKNFAIRMELYGKAARKHHKLHKSEPIIEREFDRSNPSAPNKAPNVLLNLHGDHGLKKSAELAIVAVVAVLSQCGVLGFAAATAYVSQMRDRGGQTSFSRSLPSPSRGNIYTCVRHYHMLDGYCTKHNRTCMDYKGPLHRRRRRSFRAN